VSDPDEYVEVQTLSMSTAFGAWASNEIRVAAQAEAERRGVPRGQLPDVKTMTVNGVKLVRVHWEWVEDTPDVRPTNGGTA